MSDLISRQDAIEAIEDITWYHQNRNREMVSGANDAEHQAWYKSQDIYAALESLPSAEPKTGEWEFDTVIPIGGGAYSAGYRCSNCGSNYFKVEGMSFCPNCGAKMKGVDDEID